MSTTRKFINSREVLMCVYDHPVGSYINETDTFDVTFATAREALFEDEKGKVRFTDDAAKFIRFDIETLHGEDVTEQMAAAYLEDWGGRVCDEKTLPEFVKQSEAWEQWCEDRTVRDGLAFTQRDHGNLNHRQQGIAR